MKKLILLLITAISSITSVNAQWEQLNGPSRGNIYCIAMTDSFVIAGTYGSGVFLSSNHGSTWSQQNTGLGSSLTVYALLIKGSSVFTSLYESGVYVSNDGCKTWTACNTGLTTNNIYCFLLKDSSIFAGTEQGVFRSDDNGGTWYPVNNGISNLYIHALAVNDSGMYAGAWNNGVFFSNNNGATWTPDGLAGQIVNSLDTSGANIFAATNNGLYLTANNGQNWTIKNSGLTNTNVHPLLINGSKIYAGTSGGGLFQSSDSGNSWKPAGKGLTQSYIQCLATHGNDFFAGAFVGIYLSNDTGADWNAVGLNVSGSRFITVKDSMIITGNGGEGYGDLFVSTNNGDSWANISDSLPFDTYFDGALKDSFLFVCSDNNGVYRSSDLGTSWTKVSAANIATKLYVADSLIFVASNSGLMRSGDNGVSWTTCLYNPYVDEIAGLGPTMFAATGNNYNYISRDYGQTWSLYNTPLPFQRFGINGSKIFASCDCLTDSGVYLSLDTGNTWTLLNYILSYNEIMDFAPGESNEFANVYANGMYTTSNNGENWSAVNTGLPELYLQCIATNNNYVYASTSNHGVWRMSNVIATGIENSLKNDSIYIYPNPLTSASPSYLQFNKELKDAEVVIYDVLGKEIRSQKMNGKRAEITKGNLLNGVYFVKVNNNESHYVKKIVVE